MKKPDCYIGIDPGVTGSIAVIDKSGLHLWKMPRDQREMLKIFKEAAATHKRIAAFIEDVHLWHSDTRTPGKVFNMQPMLDNAADCRFCLTVSDIKYQKVEPLLWQKALRVFKKGSTRSQRKKRHADFARTKYPAVKITQETGDSVCIAIYGYKWTKEYLQSIQEKLTFE